MTIRGCFVPVIGFFFGVLSRGAPCPATAEPYLSSDGTSDLVAPIPPEDLGLPPAAADTTSTTSTEGRELGEPLLVSSIPDFDPWAYAFAESSRLQAVAFRGAGDVPTYEVRMNP